MPEPMEIQRVRAGCGVQGCLFAAVAVFVLLLIGTLVIGIFRFSEPPAGPPRPMSAVDCRQSAPAALLPGCGGGPASGMEGRGGAHG